MKALALAFLLFASAFLYWASSLPKPSSKEAQEFVRATLNNFIPLPTAEDVPVVSEPPPLAPTTHAAPEQKQEEPPEYDADFVVALEAAIHDGINVERVRNGLRVLKYDEALADVARLHSADMAKNNYFAHEDDDGCDSACRLDAAEYKWRWVGENLFLMKSNFRYTVSDAAAVIVQGWMGSEGHRKNILQKVFTDEGLGIVVSGDSIYATELFSRPR